MQHLYIYASMLVEQNQELRKLAVATHYFMFCCLCWTGAYIAYTLC
jgi:hypothetical protein